MKTILIMLLLLAPIKGHAADKSFAVTGGSDENVILTAGDTGGLNYDRNYYITPGLYQGKRMSATVTYTSTTYSNVVLSSNSFTSGSASISKSGHGLTTGMDVLLRQTAGTVPVPLIAETTYYAYRVSSSVMYLATTSAQAIANDPIVILSTSGSGTQTYTLIPLAITGTPSFKWQGSNDASVWSDINTSSITMSAYTLGGLTSSWDIGEVAFSDYRIAVIAPTTGGIYINSVINLIR